MSSVVDNELVSKLVKKAYSYSPELGKARLNDYYRRETDLSTDTALRMLIEDIKNDFSKEALPRELLNYLDYSQTKPFEVDYIDPSPFELDYINPTGIANPADYISRSIKVKDVDKDGDKDIVIEND